ncbi:MAG: sugar transferase [Clostridia bacterium]|nr:sugar transferase [Clostridia bacterium]
MGNEEFSNLKKILICVLDLFLINLAYILAFYIRFDFSLPKTNFDPYVTIIPFISLLALVLINVYGLLSVVRKSRFEIVYSIALTVVIITISGMALTFFFRGFAFPRSVFLISAVLQSLFLITFRMILWFVQKKRHGTKNVMIIGLKNESEETAKKIIKTFSDWFQLKYICMEYTKELVSQFIHQVDLVIICPGVSKDDKESILQLCLNENKEAHMVPDLFEILVLKSKIRQFDDVPTLRIDNLHLTLEQRFLKRTFDLVVSIIAIFISFPIMLLIAALIKFTSPGPIIYSQKRVGRDGKIFNLHKFRTMINDAEKITGPVLATKDDPRITKVGKILRATRLDELPQLFNVLKGEMSLVGPRPERPYFVDKYVQEIPSYVYRTTVKSGITGLAQVLGKYRTTPEDKLRFDLLYIRNYSFMLDLKIILQTIKILLIKDSSEGTTREARLKSYLRKNGCKVYEEDVVMRIEKAV